MTIPPQERRKMLAVHLCGPRVIARLESVGITRLGDLAPRDPQDLVQEVNIEAGRTIWHAPMATRAMASLIRAARQLDGPRSPFATNVEVVVRRGSTDSQLPLPCAWTSTPSASS